MSEIQNFTNVLDELETSMKNNINKPEGIYLYKL